MNDQLLDYLLDQLDEPARRQVEARLQVDAEARRVLEGLRQALAPLEADRDILPPPNLAARTVGRVAAHICRDLPRSPTLARPDGSSRPWWRRADVLVAASLLLTFVGIGLPVLSKLRTPAGVVECGNNLKEFYFGLKAYEDIHGRLPVIFEKAPQSVAGMVVPVLNEANVLAPGSFSIRCPGHGTFQACPLTLAQVQALSPEQFAKEAPKLLVSYAYSLGYRDADGTWHAVARIDDAAESLMPVLADGPPVAGLTGNSSNHAGRGQNVLYLDGHVRFLTLRRLGGDDIFLNRVNLVAAGLDSCDAVLGASASQP